MISTDSEVLSPRLSSFGVGVILLAAALALPGGGRAFAAPVESPLAPPGVLLHVPFDLGKGEVAPPRKGSSPGRPGEYPRARFAAGSSLPTNIKAVTHEPNGRLGGAALVTGGASILAFDALGNLHARRGTLAFWARLNRAGRDFKGRDGTLVYVNGLQAGAGVFFEIRIRKGGETMSLRGTAPAEGRLNQGWRANWMAGEWRHFAIAWDMAMGFRVYMDGKRVAEEWNSPIQVATYSLDNISLACTAYASFQTPQPIDAALDELWVFDYVLTEAQVGGLMSSNTPPEKRNEPGAAEKAAAAEWLDACYGLKDEAVPEYKGGTLVASLAEPRRALDVKMELSHPVDGKELTSWPNLYKGYSNKGRNLEIALRRPSRVNYVRVHGDLRGRLTGGGREALDLPGASRVQRLSLPETAEFSRAVFERESGLVRQAGLYHLSSRPSSEAPAGDLRFYCAPADAPRSEDYVAQRINGDYLPADRVTLAAVPAAPPKAAVQPVAAHRFIHLVTEPLLRDFGVGAWRLDLRAGNFEGPTTLLVQIQDPVTRTRKPAEFDLRFHGTGGEQTVSLLLEGPVTALEKGRRIWITLLFDRSGAVICGPGGTALAAASASPERIEGYLDFMSRVLCDQFMFMSEPAPWRGYFWRGGRRGNPAVQFKGVGEIFDLCRHLLHFDPEHEAAAPILSWMMRWSRSWDPAFAAQYKDPLADVQPALPPDAAPDWAVWGRRALKALRRHVDWWTLERATETGEIGSNYEDDTDLINDYVNFALIHDPDDRLKDSYRRLADYCWENYLTDGLSRRLMDHLHAFEEGTNIQHALSILSYGDPEAVERLMTISRSYEKHLTAGTPDGGRVVRSHFYSATQVGAPLANIESGMILVFQPGRYLVWYNGNPQVLRVLTEWQDSWLDYAKGFLDKRNPKGPAGVAEHLLWACEMTGDGKYRQAVVRSLRGGQSYFRNAWAFWRRLHPDAETDETVRTQGKGNAWMRYKVTGDRGILINGLKASSLHMEKYLPVHTWVGQSADRVSIPQNAMACMYLGGVADVAKRFGYHLHSVSWEGADDEVARFVVDDGPSKLKVLLYSFHEKPQQVTMRVWRLEHGRYRVRAGADTNGDEDADQPALDEERVLMRYSPVTFTVPPRQVFVVACEQKERIPEDIRPRPDLAVGPRDIRRDGKNLRVTVHNIGGGDAPASVVRLTRDGRIVAEKPLPPLGAPLDLQPRTATVVFEDVADGENLTVEVDPGQRIAEIAEVNNSLRNGIRPKPRW